MSATLQKMRFTASVFIFLGAILANDVVVLAQQRRPQLHQERGVILDLLGINKYDSSNNTYGVEPYVDRGVLGDLINGNNKVKPDIETVPVVSNTYEDDCVRKYPLTSVNYQQVPYAFKRYGIAPHLTPPPYDYLEVFYPSLVTCQPYLGNVVNVCGTNKAPKLNWHCRNDRLYTVFFMEVFPLGLAHPKLMAQGILWWVVNVPVCDVARGRTLYAYQMPTPLFGAGKGPYVFLVYEQPSYTIDWSEEANVTETSQVRRYYSCLDKLVVKYDLKLVAGNFYETEFQSCVNEFPFNLPKPQYITKAIEKAGLPKFLNTRGEPIANEDYEEVDGIKQKVLNETPDREGSIIQPPKQ